MKTTTKVKSKKPRKVTVKKQIESPAGLPVVVDTAAQVSKARTTALVSVDPQALLAQAIEKGLPLESMERLLAMRRELKAEWSRERFFDDLAQFQAACPVIGKSKGVNDKSGKLRYKFAPLDEIVAQVKKPLEKYGFSYTIITKQSEKAVTAICNAHHVDGHTEASEFTIPIDPEAYMNDAQKIASAMTYATRYAFRNAFGVVTGDVDDDGVASGENGGGHEEEKIELRPPQARNVTPPVARSAPVPQSPYAEIMTTLRERVQSKEGPMIALFDSHENMEWKLKADESRKSPDELQGVQQELESIAAIRRQKVKEGV